MTKGRTKRIGVDARLYGPSGKGLGRYIQEVLDGVLAADKENEYVVFLYKDNYADFNPPSPRVTKVLVNARWYSLAEQFVWPGLIRKYNLDLMHFPHFNVPFFCPTKFVVTIHDLILTKYPSTRASTKSALTYGLKHFFYKIIIKRAIKKSAAILTVSQFTKRDIVEQFGADKAKIFVTYEGVSARLAKEPNQDDKKIVLGYNIHSPYLLYVGNAYPHKNLSTLAEVFTSLREKYPDLSLVLVGGEDYFYQRLKKQVADKQIKGIYFPGFVPDKDLVSFYTLAAVYVFPSKYEGFGLPPLEAMAYGCPVACSNKSSLPEVLGEAAIYFDPDDQEAMRQQLERLLTDKNLRQKQIDLGYKKAQQYSWSDCVDKTMDLYGKVLGSN